MFQQVIPRSFVWLVGLYAALIIGIIGCGSEDDENDWVGTWVIVTVDDQNFEQALEEEVGAEEVNVSIITHIWTFNDDGTMESELSVKIEAKEGGSEISANISTQATGNYSLSGSNYILTITTEEGASFFGGTDEDTGTWSRSGNTLTLNSDDGTTIVFKRK